MTFFIWKIFYYTNHGKKSFAKPTRLEAIENYLSDHVDEEKLLDILQNASEEEDDAKLFKSVNLYFRSYGEFADLISGKMERYGQRGMRLVRLLKDITQKSQVKLNDAWQGKWKETSKDLHMYFNWYKKGIRMPCVEFWFDKFETPKVKSLVETGLKVMVFGEKTARR